MNIRIIIIAFTITGIFGQTQAFADPFAVPEAISIDRSSDQKSDAFLSDELLKAFDEERLDDGVGKESDVIRITVLRSFDAPLMFKYFPASQGKDSILEVKRLKVAVDEEGSQTYQGVDFHRKVKLLPAQTKLLKEIYEHSPIQELPQKDWMGEGLDGSIWTYEVAASDGSIVISRWSPINPSLDGSTITNDRLSKELQLTSFSLVVWTLSGIDERVY